MNTPSDMNQPVPAVNPIPPVVIALCLIAVAVELVLSAGAYGPIGGPMGAGWRIAALQDYSVSPAVLDWIIARRDTDPALLMRFITYPFIHASFTQALFGAALLLALGKFVGDVLHPLAMLGLFVVTAIGGAIVFCVFVNGTVPLFGLYPPIFGLIGAYTYIIWLRLGAMGQNQLQAFRLIGFLLGLQLVFGLLFGSSPTWIAEVSAFVVGIVIAPVLAPGGFAGLVERLRQRQ